MLFISNYRFLCNDYVRTEKGKAACIPQILPDSIRTFFFSLEICFKCAYYFFS